MNKEMKYNTILPPFKWFILENFPYIEDDFDALTNWQLFCKLGKEMNKIIQKTNLTGEQVENLTNAFNSLKSYIDNYFDNLDVQEEINNKLDDMVEDGTLQEIIADYLNSQAVFGYNNVESMKTATNLLNGSYARTYGYYSKNDGGGAFYKIRTITNDDVVDEMFIIAMNNETLIAELIIDEDINLLQLGAKNDNSIDISTILNNAIQKLNKIIIPRGIYKISNDIILKDNLCLRGEDKPQLLVKNTAQVKLNANATSNYYCNIYNINFRFSGVRETFGIDLHDIVYSTIEDCTFRSDDGETTYNGMRLIKEAGECFDNTISNCFFQRNALTLDRTTDNFIINNKIWANGIVGHALDLIGNCGNNLIKGNHIIGGTQGGINASDMVEKNQLRIVDNYFDTGVKGITGKTYRACVISNNIFFNMTSNPIEIQQLFSSTIANNSFYQNGVTTKYSNINITYNHGGNTFANNVHFRQNVGDTNNKPPYYIVENTPIADSVVIGDNETFTSLFATQTGTSTFHFKNCYPTALFPHE